MNTSQLRSKRVIIPTIAAIAVLGGGGLVWSSASADDLTGGDLDRASSAAVEVAGGGTVTDAETSDDPGETYEVEVRLDDGSEVEVTLDDSFGVIDSKTEGPEVDGPDADDRALTTEERSQIESAALKAVGGGVLLDAEVSDDVGEAFEAEVRAKGGTEWDVSLDEGFVVVNKSVDD